MPVPTFRSSGTAASGPSDAIIIAAPGLIANDDILVATLYAEPHTQAITPPTGFTSIARINHTVNGFAQEVFWKRAASESGPYTFTATGNVWGDGAMIAVIGCRTGESPVDTGGVSAGNSGDDAAPTALGLTTQTNDVLLCWLALSFSASAITPPTGFDARVSSGSVCVATAAFLTAGATGNKAGTMTAGAWTAMMVPLASIASGGAAGQPALKRLSQAPYMANLTPLGLTGVTLARAA